MMRVATLAGYLIGNRRAIVEFARARHSIWIGLLLVISATLAREYDAHDLRSEPWHLLVPLGASLLMSALLYGLLYLRMAIRRAARPGILRGYRTFLGLFWMTAPLAWLYAVPYERFLSDIGAAKANLWTLAIVAAWRVGLISRVISILVGCGFLPAFLLVMVVADAAVLVALAKFPNWILVTMAGLQLPPRDQLVLSTAFVTEVLSGISLPFWLIAGIVAFFAMPARWQLNPVQTSEPRPRKGWLAYLAVASILFWLPILPRTQREQHLKFVVEGELRTGRVAEALATMSSHSPGEFPPHWDPPPRAGYDDNFELILDVMERAVAHPASPWVRELYFAKFAQSLVNAETLARYDETFATSTWPRAERLLTRMSAERAFLAENKQSIETIRHLVSQRGATQATTSPATSPTGAATGHRD